MRTLRKNGAAHNFVSIRNKLEDTSRINYKTRNIPRHYRTSWTILRGKIQICESIYRNEATFSVLSCFNRTVEWCPIQERIFGYIDKDNILREIAGHLDAIIQRT